MLMDSMERLRGNFDSGEWGAPPPLAVSHVKFFVDGMPSTKTAFLLEPYNEDQGAPGRPDWRPGSWRGEPYFSQEVLERLVLEAASRGFHPHFHVIADGASAMSLSAVESMRKRFPGKDLRPGLAHLDLVTPGSGQLEAMRDLGAYAVLSFQWCGQTRDDIEGQLRLFGPGRFQGLECHARFLDSGVAVACGSDWPVEPLDVWRNLQIGMTRRAVLRGGAQGPRLDTDRGLTLLEALRAATITAASAMGRDSLIGSLEPGKLADMAVIKGDLFSLDKSEIHSVEVRETIVGGRSVWRRGGGGQGP
jgi:predicted amidohydrolase YtcJ